MIPFLRFGADPDTGQLRALLPRKPHGSASLPATQCDIDQDGLRRVSNYRKEALKEKHAIHKVEWRSGEPQVILKLLQNANSQAE